MKWTNYSCDFQKIITITTENLQGIDQNLTNCYKIVYSLFCCYFVSLSYCSGVIDLGSLWRLGPLARFIPLGGLQSITRFLDSSEDFGGRSRVSTLGGATGVEAKCGATAVRLSEPIVS